jgi:hypothetical protein
MQRDPDNWIRPASPWRGCMISPSSSRGSILVTEHILRARSALAFTAHVLTRTYVPPISFSINHIARKIFLSFLCWGLTHSSGSGHTRMHAVHCCLVCFAMPQYSSPGARQVGETKALSCCRKNMSSTSCLFFFKEKSVYYIIWTSCKVQSIIRLKQVSS